jgi:tetratricopeptide (TPR) repeat protein
MLHGAADVSDERRDVLEARIWISIALDESELRSVEAGLAALANADEFARRTGDPSVHVLLHTQLGSIQLRRGAFDAARAALDEAVGLLDHAQPREQASILLNRGTVGLLDGRLREARVDLEGAVRTAGAAGLQVELFKGLHNLAYLEFLAGDLPRALRLMDEAGAVDADVSRGVWLLDRARVLVEAGLAREADEALARASEIMRRDRLGHDLSETLLERAQCALALGDGEAARRFARTARERFGRRASDGWRRNADLVLLQADLSGGRRSGRFVDQAMRLRDEFLGEGLRLRARSAGLIAVEGLLGGGRVPAADDALRELGSARRDDPITGRMHSHYVHARVAAARGQRGAAARRIRRALDELARYQASFGSIDLRTASAVHGRRLAELDITLALQSGRAASVFAAAERARAVSSRLPAVRPPDDPAAADLLAELRRLVESLRAVEQDRAASEPLLRRRRELERQIAARSWTRSGSGAVDRPAALDEVRARLAERGPAMVTYVQAAGRLSAVVLGRRPKLFDLGPSAPVIEHVRRVRADLDVLAQPRLPGAIRAAVRLSLQRSLAELDDALLAPLDADGSLVLVSTGVLGELPWASLPSLRRRPIVVAPSATKWLASTAAGSGVTRVAAFAGPDLGRGEHETAAVLAAWPGGRLHVGPQATSAACLEAMAATTVLHVAAHGVHQPENPLFSSVRMVDGPVFAHELDRHGHAPEHVILSACEVGLATVRPGDEALGLASVLLHLGTRSVVAGVSRVGDELAEQTMAAYHAQLARGSDSSVALAEALADLDTDVTPPFVNFGAAWAAAVHP